MTIQLSQGSETFTLTPLSTSETAGEFYDRFSGDDSLINSSTFTFVDAADGLSLVVFNDSGEDDGVTVTYNFNELPSSGSWIVRDPDTTERVWPTDTDAGRTCSAKDGIRNTTGEGAVDHFAWGGCGTWKEYDVEPGETYRIRASTDGCPSCVLYDAVHDVREPSGDGNWETTYEWENPLGRNEETIYTYEPESDRIRIYNRDGNEGVGFYVQVHQLSEGAVYDSTEASWQLNNRRRTGGVFVGGLQNEIPDEISVDLGNTSSSIDNWQVLSGSTTDPERHDLDPTEPVVLSEPSEALAATATTISYIAGLNENPDNGGNVNNSTLPDTTGGREPRRFPADTGFLGDGIVEPADNLEAFLNNEK